MVPIHQDRGTIPGSVRAMDVTSPPTIWIETTSLEKTLAIPISRSLGPEMLGQV